MIFFFRLRETDLWLLAFFMYFLLRKLAILLLRVSYFSYFFTGLNFLSLSLSCISSRASVYRAFIYTTTSITAKSSLGYFRSVFGAVFITVRLSDGFSIGGSRICFLVTKLSHDLLRDANCAV